MQDAEGVNGQDSVDGADRPGKRLDGARQKGSLSGSTTEALRQLIVEGGVPAGQRLKERELCEALAVSRTPIREAIRTLTQEGLLKALPNRSAVLLEMDAKEVRSLAVVLADVERLAVELACAHATEADLETITEAHHRMVVHHIRNDLREYFRSNKEFHRRIVLAADNAVLLWMWDMLSVRVDRARYASNLLPERWPLAIKEHTEILEALIARDVTSAPRLMHNHVHNGLSTVIARLQPKSPQTEKREAQRD